MEYWQSDIATGALLSPHPFTAREDPRTPGHFFIPAGASVEAPPVADEGFAVRLSSGAWEIVEDHRGESGWVDGAPLTIVDLGPLPDGWSDTTPPIPDPPDPEEIRSTLNSQWNSTDPEARSLYIVTFGIINSLLDASDVGTAIGVARQIPFFTI